MFFIGPPFGNYVSLPKTVSIKGSYTLEPRDGLFSQILKTLRYNFQYNGWTNKIGLRNKGIDYAIQQYTKDSIISIAILDASEIPKILEKIPPDMNIELNVSCPNAEKHMETNGLSAFLNPSRDWCIVKLSPVCDKRFIDKYYHEGFRQFHCSNTVPIAQGGLSGKSVMAYNQHLIPYIRNKYPDVTLIGGGGIKSWSDVQHYYEMGAKHVAFSTVLFCPYLFGKLYSHIIRQSNR